MVVRGFTLQTWCSTRSLTGDHAWTPHRNVDMATLLALDTSFPYHFKHPVKILYALEDTYTVVVRAKEGVFQLDISTMLWRKLHIDNVSFTLYPYSFTPGQGSHSNVTFEFRTSIILAD